MTCQFGANLSCFKYLFMVRLHITEPKQLSGFSPTSANDTMSFVKHAITQNISGFKIPLLVFRRVANTAT